MARIASAGLAAERARLPEAGGELLEHAARVRAGGGQVCRRGLDLAPKKKGKKERNKRGRNDDHVTFNSPTISGGRYPGIDLSEYEEAAASGKGWSRVESRAKL